MANEKIICFGEILLRHTSPGHQMLFQSPILETYVGGAEANVAVSLANFGHDAAMVSCVPDNPLGKFGISELSKHSVNVSNVLYDEGRMGQYFLINGSGHRRSEIIYDREYSSFSQTAPHKYPWDEIFNEAKWFHLSGITPAISENTATAAIEALEKAEESGLTISFDGNYRPALWQGKENSAPPILRKILGKTNIAFINEKDISVILEMTFDNPDPVLRRREACEAAFMAFPKLQKIYSTFRGKGNIYSAIGFSRNSLVQSREYNLGTVIDRIGTGDAFAAGIIHSILINEDDQYSVEFAAAAAVAKHTIPGDFNLVTKAQVSEIMSGEFLDVKR